MAGCRRRRRVEKEQLGLVAKSNEFAASPAERQQAGHPRPRRPAPPSQGPEVVVQAAGLPIRLLRAGEKMILPNGVARFCSGMAFFGTPDGVGKARSRALQFRPVSHAKINLQVRQEYAINLATLAEVYFCRSQVSPTNPPGPPAPRPGALRRAFSCPGGRHVPVVVLELYEVGSNRLKTKEPVVSGRRLLRPNRRF